MNVLVLNWQDKHHPEAGGAEVHLHEIFSRIANQGHTVSLICCRHPNSLRSEIIDGIHVHRSGDRRIFNFIVPNLYRNFVRTHKVDIVIDDINKIPFFTPRFVKEPILAIIHHLFGSAIYRETGPIVGSYVRYFENKIGSVYCNTPIAVVSRSTKDECSKIGLPRENMRIVYNAIDHSCYPMTISEKYAAPTITCISRLKKYKSVDHLVMAFNHVKSQIPSAILRIVGTGDYANQLQALVNEYHLSDSVVFHGYVTEAEKVEILSRSHVAVSTSIKEGWGITNIEANACGTPVVSSDVPGLRDSVLSSKSGLLYPYGNVDVLASILCRLLQNPSELAELSRGALDWAYTFSWARSAREMLDYMNDIVSTTIPRD